MNLETLAIPDSRSKTKKINRNPMDLGLDQANVDYFKRTMRIDLWLFERDCGGHDIVMPAEINVRIADIPGSR